MNGLVGTGSIRRALIAAILSGLLAGMALWSRSRKRRDKTTHWRITLPQTAFHLLMQDPEFREVVKLARAANAVLFCQLLLIEEAADTAQRQRIRMNAFLYLCPVLYEALDYARNHLGKHLRHYTQFTAKFQPLFKDKRVWEFHDRVLKTVRNQGVFHFSSEGIPNGLAGLDRDSYDFVIADGQRVADVYHVLADEAVVHAGFGVSGTREDVVRDLRPLIQEAARLSTRFSEAAESLIAEVLLAKGWDLKHGFGAA